MKIILSHPTGNANVRALALGLLDRQLLDEFYTTVASFSGSYLAKLGSIKVFSEINRRNFHSDLRAFTHNWPFREVGRILAMKANLTRLITHEKGLFSIDAMYRSLDRRVAYKLTSAYQRSVGGVYAYEDGAEYSFRKAKKLGMECLYDLPTGHWRAAERLLKLEHERYPSWMSTMTGFQDSVKKRLRKDKELELADRIFVASSFVAKTLEDYQGRLAPVEMIPYGFPDVVPGREYHNFSNRPLKLLFVGKMTQQKGIANLFEAVKTLGNNIELTLVGQKPTNDCTPLNLALANHKWIPTLPHSSVLTLMRESDVLIFPTLFDGFGLVITEAMAQGTPVIATERSAGPELIAHGENGWLIEAGSVEAIRSTLENLINFPERIVRAGKAAMHAAAQRSWDLYKVQLCNALCRHFSAGGHCQDQ